MGRLKGSPKTGGRQKGTPNKSTMRATRRTHAIINEAVDANYLPLDHMLRVLRDPTADERRRDTMAIAAAPYVHPRLMAAQVRTVTPESALPPAEYRIWARNQLRAAFDMPLIEHESNEAKSDSKAVVPLTTWTSGNPRPKP